MIPHVSDAEKAQYLVNAVKFPPLGDRGIDGAGLDCGFMVEIFRNKKTLTTPIWSTRDFSGGQIETPAAVENIASIPLCQWCGRLFIGIGDLGATIQANGESAYLG